MKNRHSQKCSSLSEVRRLDSTINVSQNITSFHPEYSRFRQLWKAFLQISEIEMLVVFFFNLANIAFYISALEVFANLLKL